MLSFPENGKLRIGVEKEVSDWAATPSSVPQGSGFEPILFVVFINDLPETLSSFLFADDLQIVQS